MALEADIVVRGRCLLGEGVVWSPAHAQAQWVDIIGKTFWTYDPATTATTSAALPERLACFAPMGGSRILAGFASGLAYFDLAAGVRYPIAAIEADRPSTRLNDAKLDRQGRFVFGTMDERSPAQGIGQVWSFDGRAPRVLFDDVRISNSIAFSPDGRVMYFADTPLGTIWRFDYNPETGAISDRRVFAEVRSGPGRPDGSTVDADGCLWNAEWGGGRVVRYSPEGRVDRVLPIPCSQVTCCAFGGSDFSTLFVTTARTGLSEAKLGGEPEAGATFAASVGAKGLPDTGFSGA
jgi:L-arabinonolactonase